MKKDLPQLFKEYIKEKELISRLRSETLRGYIQSFKTFRLLMPEIDAPELLTTTVITEFFSRLQHRKRLVGKGERKTGVKDSTIKTYWSKLNTFMDWLANRRLIGENPLNNISPPQPVYDDHRALTNDDIHKLISAVTLHSENSLLKKRDLMIIQLLLFCGLRRNELISLEVRDIDMEKRIVTVRGETSKSKRTRQIPIHPSLYLHLQEYFSERIRGGYKTQFLLVSNSSDKQLSAHALKYWVKKLILLSGVKFHLHRFRHTFACSLAKQNTSTFKLQRLLGHTDLRMTERYVRSLTVEDLRSDINRMDIDNLV